MLTNWDFSNEAANSETQQINRRKSAVNLVILELDRSIPQGTFRDWSRRETHIATLSTCDCKDFNFAGNNPRKTFKPCMHIYRLAMELGLIEVKHLDHAARVAAFGSVGREETQKIQSLPHDSSKWGGWSLGVHEAYVQRDRQFRAYQMIKGESRTSFQETQGGWLIHGYKLTLSTCECMDFRDRKLPCKHIYTAALLSGISIPFSENDYQNAMNQGLSFEIRVNT